MCAHSAPQLHSEVGCSQVILRDAPLLVCGKAHLVLAKCQINEGSTEECRVSAAPQLE